MITLNQYRIRALQYQHLDESQLMHDFRINRQVKTEFRDIHYIGHEIRTHENTIYHHAIILSDCIDALCNGIAAVHNVLLDRFPGLKGLTLVYLRSYLSADPDVFDLGTQDTIREEIDSATSMRKIGHFMAFGMLGDDKIAILQFDARNAIEIYGKLQASARKQYSDENLTLLGVCPAHPVSAEYNEHFDYAVERLKIMVDATIDWKSSISN